MPVLEELFTFHATLREPIDVGAVPSGRRQVFDTTGGSVKGPRLEGRVLPSGGDWLLIGGDGVGRLDVRALVETHDGATIYVQYRGVLQINDEVIGALGSGSETDYGDTYYMTTPHFETGHADYAWLNSVVAVGQGRLLPGAVEYRVFAVQND